MYEQLSLFQNTDERFQPANDKRPASLPSLQKGLPGARPSGDKAEPKPQPPA